MIGIFSYNNYQQFIIIHSLVIFVFKCFFLLLTFDSGCISIDSYRSSSNAGIKNTVLPTCLKFKTKGAYLKFQQFYYK